MKKLITIIFSVFMLILVSAPVYAADSSVASAGLVSPQFIGIQSLSANLSIDSFGCTTSTGVLRPSSNSYTSYLTVSLQKYTASGWTTIKSWSGSATGLYGVTVTGSYYVASGTYREASTAYIYNSSGVLVDSATAYSATVTY